MTYPLAILVALLLTACQTPYRQVYSPPSIAVSRPALGEVAEAYPGDPMLTQGSHREYDAIVSTAPFSVGGFVLPTGKYLREGDTNAADFFTWDEVTRPTNGGIRSDGQTLRRVALIKNSTALCVQTFTSKIYCEDKHPFERTKTIVLDADRLQRTLLYGGRVGNKINLSYREFNDNYARAAFSGTAEYDLSESKIVGYKGAQIEVLEATNQLIRYKVLRNFNDAQQ